MHTFTWGGEIEEMSWQSGRAVDKGWMGWVADVIKGIDVLMEGGHFWVKEKNGARKLPGIRPRS